MFFPGPAPHYFTIPHSASTDKDNNHLYIADRENSRVLVFDTKTGQLVNVIKEFGSRVFAAHYSPLNGKHTSSRMAYTSSTESFTLQNVFPELITLHAD